MLGSGRSGSHPENNNSIKGSDGSKPGLPLVLRNRVSGLSEVIVSTRPRDEWNREFPPTSEACLLAEEEAKGVGGVIRVIRLLGVAEDPGAICCSCNLSLSWAVPCEPQILLVLGFLTYRSELQDL